MKILHLSHSDSKGGAARAADRIHRALLGSNHDSQMWVNDARLGDWTVVGPVNNVAKARNLLRRAPAELVRGLLKTINPTLHSPALLRSAWVDRINQSDAEVVHLHWVQGEMLSVADIGRITKPLVWTLHDMWGFSGSEHYAEDFRWRDGYRRDNRPSYESGFDLNRWTWNRKRRHWKIPLHIVAPSQWLADCVRESALMKQWPTTVIPNPIDTDTWKPMPQQIARDLLGLPRGVPLVLFGAWGGGDDPRKGFELLQQALLSVRSDPKAQKIGLELVVFGQRAPQNHPNLGFPIHYLGHLHDDLSLRAVYSAVEVMVVPSMQEAFGQTASEAQACGTPVVAFDSGGLTDIVRHEKTGYLARSFDPEDLANGIMWTLGQSVSNGAALRVAARKRAVELFSSSAVAEQYQLVYTEALTVKT